jgi:hypothetical protein
MAVEQGDMGSGGMIFPQPPYQGDAWEYRTFDTVPDDWQPVAPTAGGVLAKRQTMHAAPRETTLNWLWSQSWIDGQCETCLIIQI